MKGKWYFMSICWLFFLSRST